MMQDIFKNMKNNFKKVWKFIIVILLYFFYQLNFLISLISSFGFNILSLDKSIRIIFLIINDLIYVSILIFMFRKEIKNGLKDLKNHFQERSLTAVTCWMIGCVIMTVSSIIINALFKNGIANNEALVRKQIQLAPLYMLFTCSIVAPIFEEMVFRRAFRGLIRNNWLFIILSGASFGLLHIIGSYNSPVDLLYVIPYGSMGCCFAYMLVKTKNITLPIIVHMLHNTILVLIQIIGG